MTDNTQYYPQMLKDAGWWSDDNGAWRRVDSLLVGAHPAVDPYTVLFCMKALARENFNLTVCAGRDPKSALEIAAWQVGDSIAPTLEQATIDAYIALRLDEWNKA